MVEYWRWWVVHLWVEGFFEVFATAVIAFLFTRLGLLRTSHLLVWLRVPGDTIFSIGAVAMAWFVLRLWIGPKQVTTRVPGGTPAVERSRALPR